MPAAITTLRETLATQLRVATGSTFNVYSYPPETIQANSVIIVPDDPYITPQNDSFATVGPSANFKLLITYQALDNGAMLAGIEQAVVTMFNALYASTENDILAYNVGEVSQPQILSVASGDVLSCTMQISLITEWS